MVITPVGTVVARGTTLWMQCPSVEHDTIPGLAYIDPLDRLIVAKIRDNLHDIIGKSGIAYTIYNNKGQKVFIAVLTKKFREFNVRIFNNYGNEVINVKRPFSWCAKHVLVCAPPGQLVGSVHEQRKCIGTYIVRDESGKDIYKIHAEGLWRYDKLSLVTCCGRDVGEMRYGSPVFNVTNFGVTFPQDTDIKAKAVLLGACFLIGP